MDRHRYNATRGSISEPLAEVTGARTDDPAPQFLRGIAGQYIRGRANLERAIRLKTFRLDSDRATVARLEGKQRRSDRSEEHTSELQSLVRISYAVFCLKKKKVHKTSNS